MTVPIPGATGAAELILRGLVRPADREPVQIVILTQPQVVETVESARERIRNHDLSVWDGLVRDFAERVQAIDAALEVWANRTGCLVTVVSPHDDLDHELSLYAVFVELSRRLHDPAAATLAVRSPDEARNVDLGQRVA